MKSNDDDISHESDTSEFCENGNGHNDSLQDLKRSLELTSPIMRIISDEEIIRILE